MANIVVMATDDAILRLDANRNRKLNKVGAQSTAMYLYHRKNSMTFDHLRLPTPKVHGEVK